MVGESVWQAADLADPSVWTVELDLRQRAEVIDQACAASRRGLTVETVGPADLPLSSLDGFVEQAVGALRGGRGFVLLRGFPVSELTPTQVELAYLGLGLRLGIPVGQDKRASLLGHVRDERVPRTGPSVRLYQTNQRQDFHTDGSDIVGLLCLQRAAHGGESRIASAHAVYNELLRTRPDLLEVLHEPLYWDRNDEQPAGEDPFFALPPVFEIGGVPRVFYIGWYVRDAQRHPSVPRLTPAQLEAMALLETTANDPRFYLEMDFQPGDVQLISNAAILHSREAYQDAEDPSLRRHLLRLWLTAHAFTSVDEVLLGGIPAQH